MSETIEFVVGSKVVEGEVISRSPHGTHIVIKLSRRLTVVRSLVASDEETPQYEYILYVGVSSQVERDFYVDWAMNNGGHFRGDEAFARRSKRVSAYPKELKIRGLKLAEIIKLRG